MSKLDIENDSWETHYINALYFTVVIQIKTKKFLFFNKKVKI